MAGAICLSCHHAVGYVTAACAMPGARVRDAHTCLRQSASAGSRSSQLSAPHRGGLSPRYGCHLQHAANQRTPSKRPRHTSFRARGGNDNDTQPGPLLPERWKLYAALIAAATLAATVLTYSGDSIQDALYGDGLDLSSGGGGPTPGDVVGAGLWAVSLYYCTPLQLLLLFLGEVDTARPSDWLLGVLGRATGQPVEDAEYRAPLALRAVVIAACAAGGAAIAWALDAGLGDATWSVSTGLGACIAGAVYEVGRPKRYTAEEAAQLDAEWRDFVSFANERLQRSGGGLHESEIFTAFRRSVSRYRSSEAMPDDRIRDFARNWAPEMRRTPNGYMKGVSLQQRVDPFSGAATGTAAASRRSDTEDLSP